MHVLCIPLVGPLQSWGTRSRFTNRDSERTPTKSGVLGMIASALGIERSGDISRLRQLAFAVRADKEGIIKDDFQTALDVATASGKVDKNPQVSRRYFLSDAAFMAAIGGEASLVEAIYTALRSPAWQPFLGRRSYVPSIPAYDWLGPFEAESLEEALLSRPLIIPRLPGEKVRVEFEAVEGEISRYDDPLSFHSRSRDYCSRKIKTQFIPAMRFQRGSFIPEVKDVP